MKLLDTLKRLEISGESVFAIDKDERIVFWSRACEQLLRFRARDVLGRRCHEILAGRDVHGNIHCYPNCAIQYQTRCLPEEPVRELRLAVRSGSGQMIDIDLNSFVLGDQVEKIVVHVIREASSNAIPLDASVRERMTRARNDRDDMIEELTTREREVLQHLALGLSTARIAESLGISPVTVRNHIQKVLEKLGVHTKMAAVAYAYRTGMVPGEESEVAS